MRRFLDLHTHSLFSDGTLKPAQIIELAESKRLAGIALTDHDTTEGLSAARTAARKFPSLKFVPGVEISARFPGRMLHIIGLGIDEKAPVLQASLQRLREARNERNPKIIDRLQSFDLDITMAEVLATARKMRGGRTEQIVGRMHIAETLRQKGFVKTTREAFDKYIGEDAPGYVDKECMSPREAVAAIRSAGGVAILAHPVHLNYRNTAQLEQIIREMVAIGLEGIEAYHGDHSPEQVRLYLQIAMKHKLLVTGGSDFHGSAKPAATLGRPRVPLSVVIGHPLGEKLLGGD